MYSIGILVGGCGVHGHGDLGVTFDLGPTRMFSTVTCAYFTYQKAIKIGETSHYMYFYILVRSSLREYVLINK